MLLSVFGKWHCLVIGRGDSIGEKHEEMGKQICCVNARIKGKVHALIEILGGNSTC